MTEIGTRTARRRSRPRLPLLPAMGVRSCPVRDPSTGRPQLKDRDQLSRFNFRQPPARLLAMMFLNMAVGARAS
jgi:hypothetical protein